MKGFIPYFYVPYPKELVNTPENIQQFRQAMNLLFKELEESKHTKEYMNKQPPPEEAILRIEVVNRINIYGYIPKEKEKDQLYLKLQTCTPNVVAPLRKLFEK